MRVSWPSWSTVKPWTASVPAMRQSCCSTGHPSTLSPAARWAIPAASESADADFEVQDTIKLAGVFHGHVGVLAKRQR